ncbi:gliding motility-associated C-terminal domain-containing protein [Lewinella sp. LCG006]|uniref:T9SS type B sorting domain-containing protein n=1 Tax=Lewinella sp. LCG006 TaxID=3231911 RepID=UPI003460929B
MITRYSKHLLLLLFSCCFFLPSFSQNVNFNSQADVNAFSSATTTINGNLTIETTLGSSDPISDLSNLLNLTSVTGDLIIANNDALTNLDELVNLSAIGGGFQIFSNAALTNLDGLVNISAIEGYLDIRDNDALTNLDGLANLSSVGENFKIYGNATLTNLDGLANISSIGGDLGIYGNDVLTNLDGLANLSVIGGYLSIAYNDALTNLDGLANLSAIGGYLSITYNAAITNLNGLANISSIVGYLSIFDNDALTNLDGLANISAIGGGFQITLNDALTNLDGLANLSVIGGYLSIAYNDALTNLDGLASISAIGGNIDITNNDALTNLDGFANISAIGGNIDIINNDALTNLDGFANISAIGGNIDITNNDALTNLDGFANISAIGGDLGIFSNDALTNCCAIQMLLSTPNAIGGTINITNNPSECSSAEEIIAASCTTIEVAINVPCIGANNGSIQVQITGGAAPFTYNWEETEDGQTGNGISNAPNFIIENLGASTYSLTVTDAAGTEFIQENILLTPIPGSIFEIIELTTTNSSNGTSNGAIYLSVAGGMPPYGLTWSGSGNGTQTDLVELPFTIPTLYTGEYEITVSDAIGNQQTISITLLDETVPVFPCTQPLDIVILNDVSGSVDAVEYEESKQFFVDFLNAANIGTAPDESRAAIIEWSGTNQQSIQVPMTSEVSVLQNYINFDRSFDSGTNPLAALGFGENYLASVARPDAERVLILSTDGSGGQISPSLVALADQYKAAGYHIITIAFDDAFASNYTRDLLRQVASIDLLAPGAPAYSLLDQNLAENIVNLYLCPIDPGSSATVYFDRDGAIDIVAIEANGGCPTPDNITVTFTIEALQELSIPPGTPLTFYYNNPALFGATPILSWIVPCAIPAGTSETYSVTLPVTGAANIFAILNDDNSQGPPISFPITDLDELAWSNNSSNAPICTEPLPTLQALKYTLTPTPICNNTVIYTVDVCNITDLDATGVIVTDDAPDGFVLLHTVVNNNGCATDNNSAFDIPGGCCVSITYTYDATNAVNGNYNNQDVNLSGAINQVFLDFDGATTAQEDVLIDGTIDCPSTVITFTKEVNVTDICEDAFVVYTFTIDNQLNVPLQGLYLSDILPDPVEWVFQPYNLSGLSISNSTFAEGNATFIIDEVDANTVARFSMDAALGDWVADGVLNNVATLDNVPDLENGGIQTLTSNTVTTNISAAPEIEVSQTFNCSDNTVNLSAVLNGQTSTAWSWVGTGDGTFDDNTTASTIYTLGDEDINNGGTVLSVAGNSTCGETNQTVQVILDTTAVVPVTLETCQGQPIDYAGTTLAAGDIQEFTFLNSIGCDSIVSVTVIALPTSTEALTLETCQGQTIEYAGVTLGVGDLQDFTFTNSSGCDSIVSVTVIELPTSTEALTLETCQGQTIEYAGVTLGVGDIQDFTFTNSLGCDSIVSVSVIGSLSSTEELFLNTCEGKTVAYNGVALSAGDTREFIFQQSNGCDSIVSVTVTGWPSTREELVFETCPGQTIAYNGINLSIGEQRTFTFANSYGCDSLITVVVNSKELTETAFVPNIFSPNNDGINDCFEVYTKAGVVAQNYKMQIFDRWGGLVFSSTDPNICWDGDVRGKPAAMGVYVWMLEMETQACAELEVLKGDVTLMR